jgi:acyl-CoA dehydrogenase
MAAAAALSAAAAILEEIQQSGLQRRRLPRADVYDGRVLRHGSAEQKQPICPRSRTEAAPAGLRRDRADERHRHALAADDGDARDGDDYVVNGQKIWTSRAEYSDLMLLLARTGPREKAEKRTEGFSCFSSMLKALVGRG